MEVAELELLLNGSAGDSWVFRRNPAITRPLALVGLRSPSGPPYLAPEIVLLYKAPQCKPADDADFHAVAPALGPERRAWLRAALEIHRPGHPWIARLVTMD